jgi:hypothetical protein
MCQAGSAQDWAIRCDVETIHSLAQTINDLAKLNLQLGA